MVAANREEAMRSAVQVAERAAALEQVALVGRRAWVPRAGVRVAVAAADVGNKHV